MAREIIAQIMSYLIPVLVPAIAAYLAAVILRRVPDSRIASALSLIDYLAVGIVAALYQETVADLKDPSKPGEWNDVAARAVKTAAMSQLRDVGSSVVEILIACGMAPTKVEVILSTAVEKAVVDLNTKVAPPQTKVALTDVTIPPSTPVETPAVAVVTPPALPVRKP